LITSVIGFENNYS